MSKPRWIDAGLFKILRNATRARRLLVVVGPQHGDAAIRTRAQLKAALGDGDAATLAADPRTRSRPDPALAALFALQQPGLLTTSISDAVRASAPEGLPNLRVLGPDAKGLKGVFDRKEPFVVHLGGAAAEPATLVLTHKDRKALLAPDSRYQILLRAAFARTVLFTGFELDDPDLEELLEDVARCYSGHVPANYVLVPAGRTEPTTALRASMHYGMTLLEHPAEMSASQALLEVARLLEELEIPRPAPGNPPPGFTELSESFRRSIATDPAAVEAFLGGDSAGWGWLRAGVDAPRTVVSRLVEHLSAPAADGRVRVALVRGAEGEGKSTLLRRVAWDLAESGQRVFWREAGAGVPERYVPASAEGARAIFVADDAFELAALPLLFETLGHEGQGKARFLIAADSAPWDRSGLDHRIRRACELLEVPLDGPDESERAALVAAVAGRAHGRRSAAEVQAALDGARGCLLERVAIGGGHDLPAALRERWQRLEGQPEAARLRRAWLATAFAHRFRLALSRTHLARLLGLPEAELATRVFAPLAGELVVQGSAVRTSHPKVAAAAVDVLLQQGEAESEVLASELLASLPGGSVSDSSVLHLPSELIRSLRQKQMAPLTLGRLFAAGEAAAGNDVNYWLDRGRYEADFGRWEPALQQLDRALWRRPAVPAEREHNAAVQALRARCLQQLHKKRDALAAVEEGLRLMPRDATLLHLAEKLGGRRRPRPDETPRGGAEGQAGEGARSERFGGGRREGGRGGADRGGERVGAPRGGRFGGGPPAGPRTGGPPRRPGPGGGPGSGRAPGRGGPAGAGRG